MCKDAWVVATIMQISLLSLQQSTLRFWGEMPGGFNFVHALNSVGWSFSWLLAYVA